MRRARALLASAMLALAPSASVARTSVAEAGEPIVIGRSYQIASRVLGDTRTINVHLPPHYGEPNRRFPVLFLLDGGEAEDFHHISGLTQVVAFSGRTQELIVVGIAGRDRRHDLTPPTTSAADLKAVPQAGGSAAYRRFLLDEVKPWVAARYRVGRTAIIGESLAGLFVLDTLLHAPDSFDDYIAVDPSLWWNDEALTREAASALHRPGGAGRRLWVSVADNGPELKATQDRMHKALQSAGPALTWRWDPRPDESHDSIYQPAARAALRAFYAIKPTPGA